MNLRTIKLTIQYDGTDYHGWQKQQNVTTIQGSLENSVAEITRENIAVTGASRTDKGVHAIGQVASFSTMNQLPADILGKAIDSKLPEDITVLKSEEVAENFNARYNALGKWYRYSILTGKKKAPLRGRYNAIVLTEIDAQKMLDASSSLLGTHDFSAFGAKIEQSEDTVCTINSIDIIVRTESFSGNDANNFVTIDVKGNRFLYKMVRTICGTLAEVGRGKIKPQDVKEILESRDRSRAGQTFPACGLTLIEVKY